MSVDEFESELVDRLLSLNLRLNRMYNLRLSIFTESYWAIRGRKFGTEWTGWEMHGNWNTIRSSTRKRKFVQIFR